VSGCVPRVSGFRRCASGWRRTPSCWFPVSGLETRVGMRAPRVGVQAPHVGLRARCVGLLPRRAAHLASMKHASHAKGPRASPKARHPCRKAVSLTKSVANLAEKGPTALEEVPMAWRFGSFDYGRSRQLSRNRCPF